MTALRTAAIGAASAAASVFVATSAAAQQGWGQVAAPKEEPWFDWTDPIAPGFWMAWTNATAAFFLFIFLSIAFMALLERRNPGGAPRFGVLGLETTRGDRLFITFIGSAFIFLGWIGVIGTPVWGALAVAVLWGAFVFWKV